MYKKLFIEREEFKWYLYSIILSVLIINGLSDQKNQRKIRNFTIDSPYIKEKNQKKYERKLPLIFWEYEREFEVILFIDF